SGDDLIVEYYNNLAAWVELTRHLGSSADMSSYATFTIGVPVDGYHSAFRLRFRSVATSGAFDDWFVDDLNIDYGPAIAATPVSFEETLPQNDSTYDELVIANSGLGGLSYTVAVQPDFSKSQARFNELAAAGQVNPANTLVADALPEPVI